MIMVSLKLLVKTGALNSLGGSVQGETEQKTVLTSSCYCLKCRTLRRLPPKNFLVPEEDFLSAAPMLLTRQGISFQTTHQAVC